MKHALPDQNGFHVYYYRNPGNVFHGSIRHQHGNTAMRASLEKAAMMGGVVGYK